MFSRMLLAGMTGKRIGNTGTYYRIYVNNIAGFSKCTISELEKERHIKLKHYGMLKKYDGRYRELIEKYENPDICRCRIGSDTDAYFWWGMLSEWSDR